MLDNLQATPAPPRISLADSAYGNLLEAIVNGQLPSGTDLPTVGVAERLRMSRTPVQEALRRLANDGLVEWPLGREPRVATFERQGITEIYELRMVLEGAAAERATRLMAAPVLKDLRRRFDAVNAGLGKRDWQERALNFDVHFHGTLAEAAGNQRLRADITRYRNLMRAFCRITANQQNLRDAFREHELILKAIEARAPDKARLAMTKHVEARLLAVLNELFPEPVEPLTGARRR